MMCSVLFAAGCFTGIMQGTGMISEMSTALVAIIPDSMGQFFPPHHRHHRHARFPAL